MGLPIRIRYFYAMADLSAGKKLSTARLARNLSIDGAAHATKMRPDKILALENDDYTRFGSNAYAKGFLLIYGRFLGVDVSEQVRDLDDTPQRVNIQGYQYLNNIPTPKQEEPTPMHRQRNKPPSVLPLFAFVALCLGVGVFFYVKVNWGRLEMDGKQPVKPIEAATKSSDEAFVKPVAAVPAPLPARVAPSTPEPPAAESGAGAPPTVTSDVATPTVNELSVEPIRKTYVKIRQTQNSPIIYEDYLYPIGKALKVHGSTFFIEVRDGSAVQIKMNGRPIAYQSPGVMVE